jgi:hypothetical protein
MGLGFVALQRSDVRKYYLQSPQTLRCSAIYREQISLSICVNVFCETAYVGIGDPFTQGETQH